MQVLLCVIILSLYLVPNFVISSLIVGNFKSACKTLLDIYTTEQHAYLGIKVFMSQANRMLLVFAFVGGMFSFLLHGPRSL
jgi:hypothetical protein